MLCQRFRRFSPSRHLPVAIALVRVVWVQDSAAGNDMSEQELQVTVLWSCAVVVCCGRFLTVLGDSALATATATCKVPLGPTTPTPRPTAPSSSTSAASTASCTSPARMAGAGGCCVHAVSVLVRVAIPVMLRCCDCATTVGWD